MPSFVHPMFLAALGAVAIPVLIHLINMLRHRRVEWAAMEFLLFSQKKHRTWIILKQLLLLLLRMLAVAAVVLTIAQPLLPDRWGSMLGTQRTHHIVLVDDSYSMSDHWGETTALEQAKQVVLRIGEAATRQQQPQSFTLLRFSRSGQYGGGLRADFTKESVDVEFARRLADKLAAIDVSQTAAEPLPALESSTQLLGGDDGERRVIYLISDFRARQWDKPDELKTRLTRLCENRAELHLIDCVDSAHANLGIVSLEPEEGIRAAGVRWRMEVAVKNYGRAAGRNVPILWTGDGRSGPPVVLSEIPAGGVATEKFYVNFPEAGEHLIAAQLEKDSVAPDNSRFAVVDLPAEMPVLLVDGAASPADARYLSLALTPGGQVKTGVRSRIETPRFLGLHPLDEFGVVAVSNVDHLDRSAIESLEKYASAGGGVVFFLGEQTRSDFYDRELYRDGKGIFPVPLANPEDLLVDRLDKAPDMQGEDHFIFRYLGSHRSEHLAPVLIRKYFAVPTDWKPKAASSVHVIIRLRNGAPLLVEKSFGKGRVMAFLSTAAPVWNNWASNNETASFPVVIQDLFAYLSHRAADGTEHQVGEPIELKLDPAIYQSQVRFAVPSGEAISPAEAARSADGQLAVRLPATDRAGFYQAQLTKIAANKPEIRHFAVNVDPAEGDLKALFGPDLAARLQPQVKYEFERASSFQSTLPDAGGRNLSEYLLYFLVALLILEQLLAWRIGYHPARQQSGKFTGTSQPSRGGSGLGNGHAGALSAAPSMAEGGVR